MSSTGSRIARNGSTISSTSSSSSVDTSSHSHAFASIRSPTNPTWLDQFIRSQDHRHTRLAVGTMNIGMAVLTAEMMQTPGFRGVLECLPVARRDNAAFIGWRQKLRTW